MIQRGPLLSGLVSALVLLFPPAGRGAGQDRQGIAFFEQKIRPVLVTRCYECHSAEADELEGDLWLDTREGARRGGESGAAVVPGDVEESLLIDAIHYEDFEMPPDEQLPRRVIADFEKWITMGAPDPREPKASAAGKDVDFDEARTFWSFQPIREAPPPEVAEKGWPRTDVDRFILARLESKGLRPVADADPQVLVRRAYFDLTGLPPTPRQVDAFVADPSPAAWSRLIDRLLATPQFGQRWGRHWLDVVRYGESTGMERNFTYPYAWRYRDYVIKSFNEDKPFDRFLTEQVAGDLMPAGSVAQRNEQLVATGLLALGAKSLNEPNREKFVMDVVDEQIDVTTRGFLGLTASCARCHDHKFDPIPQREYYAVAGIFCSTDTYYGTAAVRGNRRAGSLLAAGPDGVRPVAVGGPAAGNGSAAKKLAGQLRTARKRLAQLGRQNGPAAAKKAAAAEAQLKRLQAQLRRLDRESQAAPKADDADGSAMLVMAVQDAARPADTQVRIRGDANQRGETVRRGFLTIATRGESPRIAPSGSGRLQYAQWLTDRDNPLTARVAVNRVWMHLFGRGIVSTVNNFGANGARPTHPQLLDFLACEFRDHGWSVKNLIRTLMNSRIYQLASGADAKAQSLDPDNNLLWRMNQRRLEAEAIRDAVLAVSGQLDLEPGEGSVVGAVGDGGVGSSVRPERFAVASAKRSVYLPIVRGAVPEILQVFDFPDPSIIFGQREVTTVPTQALFMMNSPLVIEQSTRFAERILAAQQRDDAGRVDLAYRLALGRSPSPVELDEALQFIETTTASFENGRSKPEEANVAAWAGFCQTLFASSEFRYLD